jgi:peptidyl-prolyl cis-trans isomerase SurA
MTMHRTLAALSFGLAMTLLGHAGAFAAGIRITVNNTPITDVQIQQRAKLLQLEHHAGNVTTAATDELINGILELQEAKRLGILVTDDQVDASVLAVARNLRVSSDKLAFILNQAGVGIDTLRDRIRSTLAWNAITANVITPRVSLSEADLTQQANAKADAANSFDYILKQVTFIGKSPRMADANRYRAQFKGCATAVQLSESFTDAAVLDVGRRHATQLPAPMAAELGALPVGGISKPHADQGGVSMLAICQKDAAKDLTFLTNQLRSQAGNDQLSKQSDAYLANLRAKAKIVRS